MIGKQLQKLRTKQNLSQEQLAHSLHIERTTLSGYETDRRNPDLETLCLIADYFDVSTDYLLGRRSGTFE